MIELLVVASWLASCGLTQEMPRDPASAVDTVAVLQAAFEHSFPDGPPDSAALDIDSGSGDFGVGGDVLVRLAERVGIPVVRYSEVHSCDDQPILRRCDLDGLEQLLRVRLKSLEDGRAEVWVSSLHEWGQGRVDVGGCSYALEYQDKRWAVQERLLCWAS